MSWKPYQKAVHVTATGIKRKVVLLDASDPTVGRRVNHERGKVSVPLKESTEVQLVVLSQKGMYMTRISLQTGSKK